MCVLGAFGHPHCTLSLCALSVCARANTEERAVVGHPKPSERATSRAGGVNPAAARATRATHTAMSVVFPCFISWALGPIWVHPQPLLTISKHRTLPNFPWTLGVRMGWPRPAGPEIHQIQPDLSPRNFHFKIPRCKITSDLRRRILEQKFLGLIS